MPGPTAPATFVDDRVLRVGDVEFHCDVQLSSAPPGRLPVMKHRPLVERHLRLYDEVRPDVVVELGINRGGSTALLHALCRPATLVAVDLAEDPPPALEAYLDEQGARGSVHAHYGIDQADRARLAAVVDQAVGGRPIDLVIDDASHRYGPTKASFEVLFPRLGPDALFVIEDWNADQLIGDGVAAVLADASAADHATVSERVAAVVEAGGADDPTMNHLAAELVLARARSGDAVREVVVNEHWLVVRRGTDPLPLDGFHLDDLIQDHSHLLDRH